MRNVFGNRNKNDQPRHGGSLQKRRFSLESLEDRLLLTAVPHGWGLLAEESAAVGLSGQAQIGLDVRVAEGGRAVIGLLVSADSEGGADPGMIRIQDARGSDVTGDVLIRSCPDYTPESGLFLLDIGDGEYELTLTFDSGSAGSITCSAFLPGDLNGDGLINYSEYKMGTVYSTAWSLCKSGIPSLGVIEYYLEAYNIDLTDIHSVYNGSYDVNMDGVVNSRDVDIFQRGYYADVSVSFFELLHLTPNDRELKAPEGGIGASARETALRPDSFTADVQGTLYTSTGYDVTRFEQTGGVISTGEPWNYDCSDLIALAEDGRFVFDAAPEIFDFLAPGETLTLTFDYFLDNVTFDGLDLLFRDLYGGTVTVTVAGANDAPRVPAEIQLTGALDGAGALSFAVDLLAGAEDPDGDALYVTEFVIGGETYAAAQAAGIESDGFIYTFNPETGIMTVTAAEETAETLRWMYNAADGTVPLSRFVYRVSDGAASAQGAVSLSLRAADEPARIVSVPSDLTVVRNPSAAPGETVCLGEAAFLADREGYAVSILVTDRDQQIVNTGELADLVTASVTQSVPDGSISFTMSDPLINLLETGETYTIRFGLVSGEIEDYGSFNFTVKDLRVSPVDVSLAAAEGEIGESSAVPQNAFTAEIGGVEYRSASYAAGPFVQTSASSSVRGPIAADFTPFLRWDAESGIFLFDAAGGAFDFLAEGEVLSIAADYYLDDLVFDGYPETYSGVKGGTVTVTVTGVNDAPSGAGDYAAALSLATGELSPTVNLLSGVTDPDDAVWTAAIESAVLTANGYGIPTDADYSSCFTADENGVFGADRAALAGLLAAVPAGGTVLFQIGYSVSDPSGAADCGTVLLTVVGRNDAPSGAESRETSYDLLTGTLGPAVNVLTPATD
ncbi:MAG: hypothetical protein J6S42_09035, partial [Thermoguttaceae bacterium]|nr:hypothetical protein [Thermoguttaceae bacterium]